MKTIYYSSFDDDFADNGIHTKPLSPDFSFQKSGTRLFFESLFYRLVALPIVFCVAKLGYGLRVENKQAIRRLRGGFFLYCNHTASLDPFFTALAAFPSHAYTVCHPDAFSIGLDGLVSAVGGIPLPGNLRQTVAFRKLLLSLTAAGRAVVIFPEAHIWPRCPFIRPFPDTSFTYPVEAGLPVVTAVVTWRRGAITHRPKATIRLLEPLYPDEKLSPREARRDLRDRCYRQMCDRVAQVDPPEFIHYEKKQ